ncbi:hypothetical protein [Parasitella parasitica]|uniref:BHLH domain-containing protein n=1 Tax=Parasitella parasitica TaxID=35722 RepID=A0A0B7NV24_9FUNG|nr:hypothetical protein [Parasitella parasitica]
MNKLDWSTEYLDECPPQYQTKAELDHQAISMYPVPPFYATSPSISPTSSVMYGNEPFMTSPYMARHHGTGSPDSLMSAFSVTQPIYHHPPVPPQLVQSSSTSTDHSTDSASSTASTAYLNETIAKASALPESFYPEFLQYSNESFEQGTSEDKDSNAKKRRRSGKGQQPQQVEDDDRDEERRPARKQKVEPQQDLSANVTELRRQIHIQSEQKRRAQIKDGFEDLRTELPACLNKKMSKVTLLHRTVQHIQHLKSTQMTILTELERLVQENEQLKRQVFYVDCIRRSQFIHMINSFQQGVLQKQALENMYSIRNM